MTTLVATLADPVERLRSRLKWALFFRVVVASSFLGVMAVALLGDPEDAHAVSVSILQIAIAATYGVTILSAVFLPSIARVRTFAYLQLGFDVVLTTGVLYVSGGADSPFGFLYSLVVINAAMLLSTPGAVATAAGGSIAYATLVIALQNGLIARPDYPVPPAPPDLQFALRFAITNATFFIIAALAVILARRLHDTEGLLQDSEAQRDRLASLHDAVTHHIDSAVITTDPDGVVTAVNRTAETIVGQPTSEVVGRDIGALFAPLRHSGGARLRFLQSSNGPVATEFVYRRGEDKEVLVRCSAVPLRDTYQNTIGALYIVQDITELRRLEEQVQPLTDALPEPAETGDDDTVPADGIIGTSPAMREVRRLINKMARTDATVLIGGESGTGKELVARAVHAKSNRGARAFVAVNCGAIPETLIESELFGHVKGAYTGAVAARAGLFRMADGGTIFLDEIGELPLALQVKLLRVLQERSFLPVGADTQVSVDVRVIAASNRNLEHEVQAGRFRTDLFYRLNVLNIDLPPLRERTQDIPLLLRRFLRQFSELDDKSVHRLSVGAARRLQAYPFPGNVRELENVLEHAVALCDGDTIQESHLPEYVLKAQGVPGAPRVGVALDAAAPEPLNGTSVVSTRHNGWDGPLASGDEGRPGGNGVDHPSAAASVMPPPGTSSTPWGQGGSPLGANENLDDNLATYEKAILLHALAETGGVKKRAAELLGINYRSFRHRLQKYGLNDTGPDSEELSQPAA